MPLGCKIGETTIRFDDLTPQAWMEIERSCKSDWSTVYVAPMSDLAGAVAVVCECVKVAEPGEGEPMARALALTATLGKMAELWVDVDDDLPTQFTDGVPDPKADGDSTTSSSSG